MICDEFGIKYEKEMVFLRVECHSDIISQIVNAVFVKSCTVNQGINVVYDSRTAASQHH